MNDDAQWIVLLGLIISVAIFFLALTINQSILVGQTTSESVLEFPKSDIQDLRNEVWFINRSSSDNWGNMVQDIETLSLQRKGAFLKINTEDVWTIKYNNGVTSYEETIAVWDY